MSIHNLKFNLQNFLNQWFWACCLILICATPLKASQILPYDLRGDTLPFLPYLEYMLDENGSLDIESVSLQEKSLQFLPLKPLDLELNTGTFWLRFTLGAIPEGERPKDWLLSLGSSFPGDATLYVPEIQSLTGMQQWKMLAVTDRHIVKLPDPGSEPKTCYLRLAGPPGLWFAPMLRSQESASNNWGPLAKPAITIFLGVLLLICLLRSISKNGHWRLWLALFVGGALASGYLGLPTVENGHIGYSQFASALAPGLTLLLLPHVARHMMRSSIFSRMVDAQLILLTLVGAVLALLPFVPGMSWTARFLELWPLGTTLFIPTALWALFVGLPCSQIFLLACFIPPISTAGGIFGLLSGLPAEMLAALPQAGVALSALLLTLTPNPRLPKPKEEELALEDSLPDNNLSAAKDSSDSLLSLDDNPRDQELSLIDTSPSESQEIPLPKTTDNVTGSYSTPLIYDAIRILFLQAQTVAENAQNTLVEAQSQALLARAKDLLNDVSKKNSSPNTLPLKNELVILNLKTLMAEIYSDLQPKAEPKKVALGWYLPPKLPQVFKVPSTLKNILTLLVENAVSATSHGQVEYGVWSKKMTNSQATLIFSVRDSGSLSPKNRSGLALMEAWQLVASLGGELNVQSQPKGTYINFKLPLEACKTNEGVINPIVRVFICSAIMPVRAKLLRKLEGLNIRPQVTASLEEAFGLSPNDPPGIIIAHDTIATPAAKSLIAQFRNLAREHGLPFCKIIAITKDEHEWTNLGNAGFTYALHEDDPDEYLISTVEEVSKDFAQKLATNKGQVSSNLGTALDTQEFLGAEPTREVSFKDLVRLEPILEALFDPKAQKSTKNPLRAKPQADLKKAVDEALNSPNTQPSKKPEIITKIPTAKVNNFKNDHLADETDWVGEPTPINKDLAKNQKNSKNDFVEEHLTQASLTPKAQAEGTWFGQDEWVGEPTPIKKGSANTQDFETLTDKDEWVSEPTPIKKAPAKTQDFESLTDQDEWVGEPTPVTKNSAKYSQKKTSSSADFSDDPINYAEGWADEWVGEPIPILKGAKPTAEEQKIAAKISEATKNSTLSENLSSKAEAEALNIIEELDKETAQSNKQNSETSSVILKPEVSAFLDRVDLAILEARTALSEKQSMRVAQAASRIAAECEAFGFRHLARMARCVEEAGKVKDLEALNNLFPELARKVDDNRLMLSQFNLDHNSKS